MTIPVPRSIGFLLEPFDEIEITSTDRKLEHALIDKRNNAAVRNALLYSLCDIACDLDEARGGTFQVTLRSDEGDFDKVTIAWQLAKRNEMAA